MTMPVGGAFLRSPADAASKQPRAETVDSKLASGTSRELKPMDTSEVQSVVFQMVADAVQYVDQELSPARAQASHYYQAENFGNEEEGRSQFIDTVVRDTINMMMPSLLKVFFGGDRAVEYAPRSAKQVEMAQQATEYINDIVICEDNPGFLVFHNWFKDALLKKLGIVKWWYDDVRRTTTYTASYATVDDIALMEQDEEVTITAVSPMPDAKVPGARFHEVEYTRKSEQGLIRFSCLPPEEYLFTRGARTNDNDPAVPGVALFVGHRTEMTRSQLLELGVSNEDLDEWGYKDASLDANVEEIERQQIVKPDYASWGPIATRKMLWIEGYPYLDVDGDGVAELRRVCMLGPSYHVVSDEPWDERPFAVLCPDPEPHTIVGQSVADYTMDLQKLSSMVWRSMLDSLALSINPRLAYAEGEVALEDVMNTEIGAPIRTRGVPSQVLQEFKHSFVGGDALPVLDKIADKREDRTGITKASAGLDPDALQSTTRAAVAATVTASQQHIEMIARIFAETGVKQLMKGLLRQLVSHKPKARMARVRGKYVEMDPRQWDANLDVRVNVALGGGLDDEKVNVLMGVVEKQELILQTLGPTNPIVSLKRYRDTLVKIARLKGRQDADEFFGDVDPTWQPPPPPPGPEQAQAQAELMRAETDQKAQQAKQQEGQQRLELDDAKHASIAALKREHMQLEDERERDRIEAELLLRLQEFKLKYRADIDIAEIKAEMERHRSKTNAFAHIAAAHITAKAKADAPDESGE